MIGVDTRFIKGLNEIPSGKMKEVRAKLMEALRIKDRHAFYFYRDGKTNMTVDRWMNVGRIFAKYGVKDPWGA